MKKKPQVKKDAPGSLEAVSQAPVMNSDSLRTARVGLSGTSATDGMERETSGYPTNYPTSVSASSATSTASTVSQAQPVRRNVTGLPTTPSYSTQGSYNLHSMPTTESLVRKVSVYPTATPGAANVPSAANVPGATNAPGATVATEQPRPAKTKEELSPFQAHQMRLAQATRKESSKRHKRFLPRRLHVWTIRYGQYIAKRLAVYGIIAFVLAAISLLPQFYVKQITITGARYIDVKKILAVSGLHLNQHLFTGLGGNLEGWLRLRYSTAENNIKRLLPGIESVEIRPSFPGKLRFVVKERIGVAYLQLPGYVVVVDSEGVVLRIDEKAPEKVPLIVGVSESQVEVGKPINSNLRAAITNSILIMSNIIDSDDEAQDKWNFFSRLKSLRPINAETHYITIRLNNGREMEVKLGDVTNIQANIYWLRSAVKMGVFERLGKGLLDLSGKQKIYIPAEHFSVKSDLTQDILSNTPEYKSADPDHKAGKGDSENKSAVSTENGADSSAANGSDTNTKSSSGTTAENESTTGEPIPAKTDSQTDDYDDNNPSSSSDTSRNKPQNHKKTPAVTFPDNDFTNPTVYTGGNGGFN